MKKTVLKSMAVIAVMFFVTNLAQASIARTICLAASEAKAWVCNSECVAKYLAGLALCAGAGIVGGDGSLETEACYNRWEERKNNCGQICMEEEAVRDSECPPE